MALKPDRSEDITDISYFVTAITGPNTDRMERGGILCAVTGTPGSGAAMDTSAQAAQYATTASGRKALGILLNDFVNIDQSRQQLNPYKNEQQIGTKAVILRKGWVVTNMIDGNVTGSMPAACYGQTSGLMTPISGAGLPLVGEFLSRADAEGYAKVKVDL